MWHNGKESACQCRRHERHRFSPWIGKIPWGRKWQPSPVFLPGKVHGQRRLAGYSSWGHKKSDTTEHTHSQLTSNVVIVSGKQWRDSAIHIHGSILPQTPLPSKLPHNTEQSYVLYSSSLLVICFKYSSLYMSIPKSLTIPSPHSSPLITLSSFSKFVSPLHSGNLIKPVTVFLLPSTWILFL